MPSGSPATQFGQPGGPDPSEAGKKGGGQRGTSILTQMHNLMSPETARLIAQAHIAKLKTAEDIALFKEYTSRQDGPITQSTDLRVTGDRTVIVETGGGELPPKVPPEEGE